MRTYEVVLSPEAQADLEEIYDWIAERASPAVALGYLERPRRAPARLRPRPRSAATEAMICARAYASRALSDA